MMVYNSIYTNGPEVNLTSNQGNFGNLQSIPVFVQHEIFLYELN